MRTFLSLIPALSLVVLPKIASAYTFADLAYEIVDLINGALVPILFSLSLAAFIYGVAKTILQGDNSEAQIKGRNIMIYGLISLFVITSLWSIINIVRCTFFGDACLVFFF